MEERYKPEVLDKLDELIEKLRTKGRVEPKKEDQYLYKILGSKGWIKNNGMRYENQDFSVVAKSPDFDHLYEGGAFRERYERRVEQSKSETMLIAGDYVQGDKSVSNITISGDKNKVSVHQKSTEVEKKSFWERIGSFLMSIIKFFLP